MELIDCFGRSDIFFPDADGFRGSDDTRVLDKSERIAASSGGTHDMGGTESGIYELCGCNCLDNGFTSSPAENKQDSPIFIRQMIGHADSPALCSLEPCFLQTGTSCPARVAVAFWYPDHRSLDLCLEARDPAR